MEQNHLSKNDMTNLGCFYTPEKFINKIIEMADRNLKNAENYTFVDTSCGYGAFLVALNGRKTVGCDIDETAVNTARSLDENSAYYVCNSLKNFTRESVGLKEDEKIIIVGNPPYNDVTSQVKSSIKNATPCEIDDDLKTRDLGSSFLLSYDKLKADYIGVLHPLSYLIKRANFNCLKRFYKNYKLIDHCVVNSQGFNSTSKTNGFPIILAFYKRDENGMTYDEALNFTYVTIDGKNFKVNADSIANYVQKYPQGNATENDILFYTMRDVNALKRSRTFIHEPIANAVVVDPARFEYYSYVDNFKDYVDLLPYYLGNCDVFINNEAFQPVKNVFMTKSVSKHPWLKNMAPAFTESADYALIDRYFEKLFGYKEGSFNLQKHNKPEIKVQIPLTKHTGKFRVKARSKGQLFGSRVYTRRQNFTPDCYVEWQIGYDIPLNKLNDEEQKNAEIVFKAANGKKKTVFELSYYIFELYKLGVITQKELRELYDKLKNVNSEDFIEKRPEFQPKRSKAGNADIGGLTFSTSTAEYSTLTYELSGGMTAEITVREQQHASGIQAMLYVCVPISLLSATSELIGHIASKNQTAALTLTKSNADDLLKLLWLFGLMSASHNHDVVAITEAILKK